METKATQHSNNKFKQLNYHPSKWQTTCPKKKSPMSEEIKRDNDILTKREQNKIQGYRC